MVKTNKLPWWWCYSSSTNRKTTSAGTTRSTVTTLTTLSVILLGFDPVFSALWLVGGTEIFPERAQDCLLPIYGTYLWNFASMLSFRSILCVVIIGNNTETGSSTLLMIIYNNSGVFKFVSLKIQFFFKRWPLKVGIQVDWLEFVFLGLAKSRLQF